MLRPALPKNEQDRLAELLDLRILDTPEEQLFDDFAFLASIMCEAPIALISLVDKERQWFKSHLGLGMRETSRDVSFCAHAIHGEDIFEIRDARSDSRFKDNPLVLSEPKVGFYAGAPLVTERGHCIGTLCVIDKQPRQLTEGQKKGLRVLADQVVKQIQMRALAATSVEQVGKISAKEQESREIAKQLETTVVESVAESERISSINRKLETAQVLANMGSFTFNTATQDLEWSRHMYKIYDIDLSTPREHLHAEALRRIHPEDHPRLLSKVQQALETGKRYSIGHRIVTRSGELKYIRGLAEVSVTDQQKVITGVAQDVTQEVRSAETLKQKTDELNMFFNVALEMLCIAGLDGKFYKLNPIWTEVLGYSQQELLAKPFIEFVHPDDVAMTLKEMEKLAQGIPTICFENRFRAKNGVYRILSWSTSPHPTSKMLFAAARDITELRQSEALLSEAQRVAKLGSWSYDAVLNITRWSEQMFELFGRPKQAGPPSFETQFEALHPDDLELWSTKVDECLKEGLPFKMRARVLSNDESHKWIEILGAARSWLDGKVTALSGSCQDVTELVAADEAVKLERAKAMQSAKLASLGEMSAGIAHEINNPLAIIVGAVSVLPYAMGDPDRIKDRIATIERAVDRIVKIVNGLRKFSRSSTQTDMKVQSLGQIIEESYTLVLAKARRSAVTVELKIDQNVYIMCNEIEIEQVLVNLINNGIYAAQDQENRWVRVILFTQGKEAVLQIWDSGAGVPLQIQHKLFQPFFTTKPVGEGTGLGLAVTKGILDDHGATIALLDHTDHTCFEIRFKSVEKGD